MWRTKTLEYLSKCLQESKGQEAAEEREYPGFEKLLLQPKTTHVQVLSETHGPLLSYAPGLENKCNISWNQTPAPRTEKSE